MFLTSKKQCKFGRKIVKTDKKSRKTLSNTSLEVVSPRLNVKYLFYNVANLRGNIFYDLRGAGSWFRPLSFENAA